MIEDTDAKKIQQELSKTDKEEEKKNQTNDDGSKQFLELPKSQEVCINERTVLNECVRAFKRGDF